MIATDPLAFELSAADRAAATLAAVHDVNNGFALPLYAESRAAWAIESNLPQMPVRGERAL